MRLSVAKVYTFANTSSLGLIGHPENKVFTQSRLQENEVEPGVPQCRT